MTTLHACLLLSAGLFATGLVAALSRSNSILVLLGVELMLNAANLNFVAFWRFHPAASADGAATGVLFVIFAIAVAAAEAAVGLALVIAIYRHQKNIRLQEANTLRG